MCVSIRNTRGTGEILHGVWVVPRPEGQQLTGTAAHRDSSSQGLACAYLLPSLPT